MSEMIELVVVCCDPSAPTYPSTGRGAAAKSRIEEVAEGLLAMKTQEEERVKERDLRTPPTWWGNKDKIITEG
jgi:hypothetical protein